MKRKWWLLLAVAALLGGAAWFAATQLEFSDLVARERQLKAQIKDHPYLAGWIGLAVYIGLSLIPGAGGKALIFGWLFGFWTAVAQVNLGLTIAAIGGFVGSRYFLQQSMRKRFPTQIGWLDRTLAKEGPYLVLTLRLAHAPYTLVNYLLGATSLRLRTFWWATQLGLLPSNILFVYAGSQLPSLKQVASQGSAAVLAPEVLVPMMLLACLPLLLRYAFTHRPLDEEV